jgi:hypothetical protein
MRHASIVTQNEAMIVAASDINLCEIPYFFGNNYKIEYVTSDICTFFG